MTELNFTAGYRYTKDDKTMMEVATIPPTGGVSLMVVNIRPTQLLIVFMTAGPNWESLRLTSTSRMI